MVCHNACHLVSNIFPYSYLQWNKKTAWHITAMLFHKSFIILLSTAQGSSTKELGFICSCFSHKAIIARLLSSLLSVKNAINSSLYKICLKWMESNLLYLNFSTRFTSVSIYFSELQKCFSIRGTQSLTQRLHLQYTCLHPTDRAKSLSGLKKSTFCTPKWDSYRSNSTLCTKTGNASSLLYAVLFTYQIFGLNYSELHAFSANSALFFGTYFLPCQTRSDYLRPPCKVTVLHSPYLLVSLPLSSPCQANSKQKLNMLWKRSRTKFNQIPDLRKDKSKQNEMRCTTTTDHSHLISTLLGSSSWTNSATGSCCCRPYRALLTQMPYWVRCYGNVSRNSFLLGKTSVLNEQVMKMQEKMTIKPRLEHGIGDIQHSKCTSNGFTTNFNHTQACVAYSKSCSGPESWHTPSDLSLHSVLSPWQSQDERSPTEQLTTYFFSLKVLAPSCLLVPVPCDIIRIIFITVSSRLSELQRHFLFGSLFFIIAFPSPSPISKHTPLLIHISYR